MANPLILNPYANKKYTKEELRKIPDLRPSLGEAGKGIRAFADETQATGYGLYALGAQHLKDATGGESGGFLDRQVQTGHEGYARNIEESTAGRQAPNVARVEDIKGGGDFVDWATYNLAKQAPQIGMLAGGAGIGGLAARGLVKKGVADTAKAAVGKGVTQEMKDAAKVEIKKQVGRGVAGGGFAAGFGLEAGHQMGQGLEAGVDPSRAATAATVYGGLAGALEFAAPFAVAKSLGRGDFAKKSIREIIKNDPKLAKRAVALAATKEAAQRGGKAGVMGAGTEGLTEGMQELASIAAMRWAEKDEMFAELSPEDWSQFKNSVAAGALTGSTLAGAGGVVAGPKQAEAPAAPVAEVVAPKATVPPVIPPQEAEAPIPGTQGKLIGQTEVTPMHPEKKEAAPPVTPLAQVPGLEQKPLQGELVDEETGTDLTPVEEQLQLEAPAIKARFKDVTGQLRIGEQKKLETPIEVRDERPESPAPVREVADPWIEQLDDGYVMLFEQDGEVPFTVTDAQGMQVTEGFTKEEVEEGLVLYKQQQEADTDLANTATLTPGEYAEFIDLAEGDPDVIEKLQQVNVEVLEGALDKTKVKTALKGLLEEIKLSENEPTSISISLAIDNELNKDNPTQASYDNPTIAAKIAELEKQVEVGLITQDEATHEMIGLANELMGESGKDPEAPAAASPSPAIPGLLPTKTSEMEKTAGQAGSNKGGWFKDYEGTEYYVKEGQTPDHAVSEHVASQLYDLARIDTPATNIILGDSEDFAGPVIASEKVKGGTQAIQDGFVIDAWLGNWDVVGLANDNYTGTLDAGTRLDFGGALNYRAQGGKKGDLGTQEFGNDVGELKTLRDPIINPQAAKAFANITDSDIIEQAGKLARISDDMVRVVVKGNYGGNRLEGAAELVDILIARKKHILAYAEALKQQGPGTEVAGTKESLKHWVKDWNKDAPLITQTGYMLEDPHQGVWAEMGKEESRYGVLLINPETGKVLMRKPTEDYDGYAWTFAKGKAGKKERPVEAAMRELKEETGYDTYLTGQLGKPFYSGTGTGSLFYIGVAKEEQAAYGKETAETKWVTYDEALMLVKEGTNKQGVKRDTDILKNLYGFAKPDKVSEYPVKKGAAHAKSYYESGQFAEDVPDTPWKNKTWGMLTPLRQLYVKSAAFLKIKNKKIKTFKLTDTAIKKEVTRMQTAFKHWSGFSFMQVIDKVPLAKSESDMLNNFPLKTGEPFVIKAFHGNGSGEIVGDRLNPAKFAGEGAGGSDTNALSHKKGVFYMANTVKGAKAWGKVFAFYFAPKNPKVVWWNKGWSASGFKNRIKQADTEGYDSIVFVNAHDSGGQYHQFISFDAQQQVRTTMLENIGYSLNPKAKMYESKAADVPGINSKVRFESDFISVFGEGLLQQATKNGLLTINETSPLGSPAGSFDKETNQITLNLDKVGQGETPMSVLLHEGRHAGMQDVLGKSLPLFHQDLLNLADGGNKDAQSSVVRSTAAVADLLGIEHELYDLGLPPNELEAEVKAIRKLIGENERGARLLQEEDLAYYIQDSANTLDLTAPGLYRRILNALKVWWAQSGVGQMFAQAGLRAELTPEMAVELAKASVRKAAQNHEAMMADKRATTERRVNELFDGVVENEKRKAKEDRRKGGNTLASMPNPLNTVKRWWGDSTDTPLDSNNVGLGGKIRAHIIDNLATIDEKSTDVHKVAEVAKSKTSAEQSKINRMYLEPLVNLAKATGLKQEQLDEWLLARHVLLDDENWQNTQKRSWMFARDLAKSMPNLLRTELDNRRLALTKEKKPKWIDKDGFEHTVKKLEVPDHMIELVNDYLQRMEDLETAGALNPKFTKWAELKSDWLKIQAHSAGLYSPGKVDANGHRVDGKPNRPNISGAPDAYNIYHAYNEDKVQRDALGAMAKKWDEMTAHQLDLLVEGGKIGKEEAIKMRAAHSHYVKSRRKSADNDKSFEFLNEHGVGGGKPKVRAGTIEYDPVVHVMQNTIAQAHSNAAAAQQNQAALYLYKDVLKNKDHWEGWFTTYQEEVHHLDAFGFLHDRPTSRPSKFDIPVTIMTEDGKAGKTIYIRPIPQNQKAKLFAAGMNQLGAQQQGAVAKVLSLGNKIVRNMAVTFSPAFLAANIFRDPATAIYNLQATEGKDYSKDFLTGIDTQKLRSFEDGGQDSKGRSRTGLGNSWKILNSVYTDRDNADPRHVEWVEEWEHAGGRQSFTQSLKEMDDGWKSFEGALTKAKTPGIHEASKVLGWVEKYNIIVENISRFSAFSTVMEAWERGEISKWETKEKALREAAIISKELTTNFDRKGFSSQAIGLWHLFFNATVQGNVQVVRNLMGSKKLQKMVGGTVVLAIMFDLLGRAMADDDDEGRNEWDNIPDYVKERNIIIPFKIGGAYVKIPAPWVYNSVWRMGGMIGELSADKRDMASVPVDMGLMLFNTFNPMGSTSLMQSLSPTALDPFVQAVENKNFAGNPIKPTSFPGAASLPESQLYRNNTPKAYVHLAEVLNGLTGGDVATPGFVDISPGVIHNYVNFFTAGVGKAAGQVYTLAGEKPFNDKEYEIRDVPILSTYAHAPGAQVDVQLYHDRVAQVLRAQKAIDMYGKGKTRNLEKQREARVDLAKELRMVTYVKDVERQLKSLRTRMRAAQGRKETKNVEGLKKRITSIQQNFNKTFERRMQ